MGYQLLIATPSPFARKARIALREKGIPFEEIVENPWNDGMIVARRNPLAKVPVLTLPDGRSYFDSRVILDVIDTLPGPELTPANHALEIRQIEALADGICDAVVLIVLEVARPPDLRSQEWIARQRHKIDAGLAALEDALSGDHMVGGVFTRADIAAGAALAYVSLRMPDLDWRGAHPALAAYADRLEARPAFAASPTSAQPIDVKG
ncbi:MAG: glutathione S-transferase N-terminal domain-containing protein [Rhodobacteraceae bacterium]|nr:glutathione S-transferase N-terminal domain-containing protein [Paracoccaceae bacterium]